MSSAQVDGRMSMMKQLEPFWNDGMRASLCASLLVAWWLPTDITALTIYISDEMFQRHSRILL